jgi:hypothetical protein
MKFRSLAAASALSLLAAPAAFAAQDSPPPVEAVSPEGEEMEQTMAMLGSMFPAEPLTEEQQARLPQAQRVVNRMIPEGTLGEMMGSMFDKIMGPIMAATDAPANSVVQKGIGISPGDLDLSEEQIAELAALFDPAYAERHQREMALMPGLMRDMMTVMEPTMRKVMSELYAINFNQTELDDIEAFFMTETGAAYARKSYAMSSDPRIIGATMESLPQLMGAFGSMEQKIEAAGADLPAKRGFDALSKAEQARVAELTGYTVEEIAEEFARAAAAAANDGEAEGEAAELE